MRIFSNFDTKLDEKKYAEAIGRYGEKNVLLFKKHPAYLIRTFFLFVWALLLLSLLVTVKYFIGTGEYAFRMWVIATVAGAYWLWTWLIISKLKTYFRSYRPNIRESGFLNFENGRFEYLVKASIAIFVIQAAALWANIYGEMVSDKIALATILSIKLQFVLSAFLLAAVYLTIRSFIRFEMDYCLVTPDFIEYVEQPGIFARNEKMLDTDKIKSIHNNNSGIIDSVMNTGTLTFYSEGDDQGKADITADYVSDSEWVKNEILRISNWMRGNK